MCELRDQDSDRGLAFFPSCALCCRTSKGCGIVVILILYKHVCILKKKKKSKHSVISEHLDLVPMAAL